MSRLEFLRGNGGDMQVTPLCTTYMHRGRRRYYCLREIKKQLTILMKNLKRFCNVCHSMPNEGLCTKSVPLNHIHWISLYATVIEKFLYLSSLGWLLQEYNFWMGCGFQVWKFHLKISPRKEKFASQGPT